MLGRGGVGSESPELCGRIFTPWRVPFPVSPRLTRTRCGTRRPVPPAQSWLWWGVPGGGVGGRSRLPEGARPGTRLGPRLLRSSPPGRGCRRLPLQHRDGSGLLGCRSQAGGRAAARCGQTRQRLPTNLLEKLSPLPALPGDRVTEGKQAPSGKQAGAGWVDGCLPRCFADNLRHYGSRMKYLFTKEPVNTAANTLGHFGCAAYDYFRT